MTIGVLGSGQLGRMLALVGYPLGFRFHFLDAAHGESAAEVGPLAVARIRSEGKRNKRVTLVFAGAAP